MRDFVDEDLRGSRFARVDLSGASFRGVDLSGVRMSGVELVDVALDGEVQALRVNGVDVTAYVEAELDARHPERAAMRPTDAAGFRHAWDVVERLWAGTVARARALEARDPGLLHASVGGEWSFVETLRHLAFATDAWVARAVLGEASPWHPLSLPWDEMPDTPGVPRDRRARPSLDEVLALRHDRMGVVRSVVDGLTDARLAESVTPPDDGRWPPARPFAVAECLSVVLNEEWQHRLYAERDLDALEA